MNDTTTKTLTAIEDAPTTVISGIPVQVLPEILTSPEPADTFLAEPYLTEDMKLVLANSDERGISGFYREHVSYHNRELDLSGLQMFTIYQIMAFVYYIFTDYAKGRGLDFVYIHRSIVNILPVFLDYIRKTPEKTNLYEQVKAFEKETTRTNINIFIFAFMEYLKASGLAPKPSFNDDDWVIEELFTISPDRRANGDRIRALHFGRIDNEASKRTIKIYIRQIIDGSTLSIDGVLPDMLSTLTEFANFLGNTEVLKASHRECRDYIDDICLRDISQNAKSKKAFTLLNFYHHLYTLELIQEMPIKAKDCPKQELYEHHDRSMPDSVFLQFMQHLEDLPHWALVIFLIESCAGTRIGDITALRRGCLVQKEGHWYASQYISKTKDEADILLSEEVRKCVEEYLELTDDPSKTKDDYLFPAPRKKGWHVSRKYYCEVINAFIERNDIRDTDGTLYNFQTHSLRHRMATKMAEAGLTIFHIAKALVHGNLEMPLRYVDNKDKSIKEMRGFVGKNGLPVPFTSLGRFADIEFKAWLKEHPNATAVQGGMCDRSWRFGKCGLSEGECLACDYYRTGPEYLPYHRERLSQLYDLRELAVERKSSISLAKIDREIELRTKFITGLEKMEASAMGA